MKELSNQNKTIFISFNEKFEGSFIIIGLIRYDFLSNEKEINYLIENLKLTEISNSKIINQGENLTPLVESNNEYVYPETKMELVKFFKKRKELAKNDVVIITSSAQVVEFVSEILEEKDGVDVKYYLKNKIVTVGELYEYGMEPFNLIDYAKKLF